MKPSTLPLRPTAPPTSSRASAQGRSRMCHRLALVGRSRPRACTRSATRGTSPASSPATSTAPRGGTSSPPAPPPRPPTPPARAASRRHRGRLRAPLRKGRPPRRAACGARRRGRGPRRRAACRSTSTAAEAYRHRPSCCSFDRLLRAPRRNLEPNILTTLPGRPTVRARFPCAPAGAPGPLHETLKVTVAGPLFFRSRSQTGVGV
jgi:hypothetical protein